MTKAKTHRLALWITGGASCLLLIGEFLLGPKELPSREHFILGLFSSVLPAFLGYFVTGSVLADAEASWPRAGKTAANAAGGAVFFLLVLLSWQAGLSPVKKQAGRKIDDTGAAGVRIGGLQGGQTDPLSVASVAREADIVQFADDVQAALEVLIAANDPNGEPLSPEIITKAKVLLINGDLQQQAVGQIALEKYDRAEEIIQRLKKGARVEAFDVCKLEGLNWQRAGKLDRASEFYQKAVALHPGDTDVRFLAAGCLIREALSQTPPGLPGTSTEMRRAIELLEGAQDRVSFGSSAWWNAENSIEAAWGLVPREERGNCILMYINGYEADLSTNTKEAAPVAWTRIQNRIATAWCQAGREGVLGEPAESFRKAVTAHAAALTVLTKAKSPVEWALTQHRLASALDSLAPLAGQAPAERLELFRRAISAEKAAILLLSQEQYRSSGIHGEASNRLRTYRRNYEEAGGKDFEALQPAR